MIIGGLFRSVNAGPRNIAARRLIAGSLAVISTTTMTACYSYVPAGTQAAVPANAPVEVVLTAGGTSAMESSLGAGVRDLRGTVIRAGADSVVMNVEQMWTVTRQTFPSSGSTVAIPRPYIQRVSVREFSRKRTVIAVLGAIGTGILTAIGVNAAGGSQPDGNGGVTPP